MTEEKPPEKIVLPRSGLVLTKGYAGALVAPGSDVRLALDTRPGGGCPLAWSRNDAGHIFETNKSAIDWLDTRVLSLRSALLAGAEETVARALWGNSFKSVEPDLVPPGTPMDIFEDEARAVIAALCGEEG